MLNPPTVFFNETPVAHTSCQKHLGMHLYEKLKFNTHIKDKIAKANKGIGIVRILAHVLPRESLVHNPILIQNHNPILIIVMSFMINLTMIPFVT